MRQVFIQIVRGKGSSVLQLAQLYEGVNLTSMPADTPEEAAEVILVHLSNGKIEAFLTDLQERLPEAKPTLQPQDVINGVLAVHRITCLLAFRISRYSRTTIPALAKPACLTLSLKSGMRRHTVCAPECRVFGLACDGTGSWRQT